jgi:hypothetical protein
MLLLQGMVGMITESGGIRQETGGLIGPEQDMIFDFQTIRAFVKKQKY